MWVTEEVDRGALRNFSRENVLCALRRAEVPEACQGPTPAPWEEVTPQMFLWGSTWGVHEGGAFV